MLSFMLELFYLIVNTCAADAGVYETLFLPTNKHHIVAMIETETCL